MPRAPRKSKKNVETIMTEVQKVEEAPKVEEPPKEAIANTATVINNVNLRVLPKPLVFDMPSTHYEIKIVPKGTQIVHAAVTHPSVVTPPIVPSQETPKPVVELVEAVAATSEAMNVPSVKPKRVLTSAQIEALKRGREKLAEKRKADKEVPVEQDPQDDEPYGSWCVIA